MSSAIEGTFDADVLVLGASFAGLEVVLQLRRRAKRRLRVIVIDQQRTHGYLPLVHERIAGAIPIDDTALPTADRLSALPDTRFIEDEVVGLEPELKAVTLASGRTMHARFIVVAVGSVLAPPEQVGGRDLLCTHKLAPGFAHAHARLQAAFARTERARIVVVGGGISGVELAGELAARPSAAERKPPEITLVSGSTRLVPELSRGSSAAVLRALRAQGVTVELGTRLLRVEERTVQVRRPGAADATTIACDVAMWAGGVRPAPILAELPLPRTEAGWLAVGPTLQCYPTATPTHPDVFACGDAVRIQGGDGEWPTMQRAIECLWQAKVVADNVLTLAEHDPAYPEGVPPLRPHRLRRTFFYGVSVGEKSYVVYRGLRVHLPGITPWFRRWLMRQYFARYAAGPLPTPARDAAAD